MINNNKKEISGCLEMEEETRMFKKDYKKTRGYNYNLGSDDFVGICRCYYLTNFVI